MALARAQMPTCDSHYGLCLTLLRCLRSPILCVLAASLRVFPAVRSELDFAPEFAESYSVCFLIFSFRLSGDEV